MTAANEVVFLLDVDNTLLDNDRIVADLGDHLAREFGGENRDRYWTIFEALRVELGYADYLGALQRYRLGAMNDPRLLRMSSFLVDYPFAERLYPGALDVIAHLRRWGPTVILSDGDVVFQPRKVQRSGLWDAVEDRVLIYLHKEQALDDVERRYPARRYVMVDDKLRILAAMKQVWGDRLTTVFPRQGHYALDPANTAAYSPADMAIARIGDWSMRTCPPGAAGPTPERRHRRHRERDATPARSRSESLARQHHPRAADERHAGPLYPRAVRDGADVQSDDLRPGVRHAGFYDAAIGKKARAGLSGDALFFELALEDLTRAADLFGPVHDGDRRRRRLGLAGGVAPAGGRHGRHHHGRGAGFMGSVKSPNLFIKIPGTRAGLPAIEEAIFAGVPVNVTLLFSREHYLAAAEAYMRGIERRIAAGLDPTVGSVASLFVSRWDVAVKDKVPAALRNRLGIAIAARTYKAYRELLASPRWQDSLAGARPQRLLWASTGTKDPDASDTLYVEALAAPDTINTMPEKTLLAFADHGRVKGALQIDGGDAEAVLAEFGRAGVDHAALAAQLQREGARSFTQSWRDLMDCIASKSAALAQAAPGGARL